ncbi:MAG: hypothetical protein ACI9PU_000631, partial [Ascidiaceihabitans sp.]
LVFIEMSDWSFILLILTCVWTFQYRGRGWLRIGISAKALSAG